MKKQPTREKLLDVTFDEIYKHGYHATSVDAILKKASVPKGSMYHHFKNKKELVLAMVRERLFPKMDQFFRFEKVKGKSALESIRNTYAAMARNKPLIKHGCPMYRLIVEMSEFDEDFNLLLKEKTELMQKNLAKLLEMGIEEETINSGIDSKVHAIFMLNATWGILSQSPSLSSPKSFSKQIQIITKNLEPTN